MKWFWSILFVVIPIGMQAQFLFKGEVSKEFYGQQVYLSLVEDYRKVSRVYLDQIIQRTKADSLGNFSFNGNQLPETNRIYRIHVDGCDENTSDQNHFLRECSATQSMLFIARNHDTVVVPLDKYDQAFCEITSTNTKSGHLLEIEALKEEMILDLIDSESETARLLLLDRWFKTFQDYSKSSKEPLVELYAYNFLSDRSSETHYHYLKDLSSNSYYTELASQLIEKYPKVPFTAKFQQELFADRALIENAGASDTTFKISTWLPALSILVLSGLFFMYYTKKKSMVLPQELNNLSPQEQKIYAAIKEGKTNKEIASGLFISLSTVKTHINNIYKKLGVTSRDELT